MEYKVRENLVVENAKIIFKNFEGNASAYNRKGNRNFCVIIDDLNTANELSSVGWNVKIREPKEEGDNPYGYMRVNIQYNSDNPSRNPKVVMITNSANILLTEETISELDHREIEYADVEIRPYNWSVNGSSGVSGYLDVMYVKVRESKLAGKYGNLE